MEVLKKNLATIYSFAFFINLFFAMVLLGIPLYAIELEAGNIELGWLGSLGAFTYTISVPFSGWLADRFSKRWLSCGGAVIFGLAVLIAPFLHKLVFLYFIVFGYSLGQAFIWPAMESRLSQIVPKEKLSFIVGWYNLSWCLGFIFGPYLAGWIFERKTELVFWIAGLGGIVFSVLSLYSPAKPAVQGKRQTDSEDKVYFLYLAWMANIMLYFVQGVLRNIFPKLATELGISSGRLGLLFLLMSLAQGLFFVILNLYPRWHFRLNWLLGAQVLGILGLVIIVFSKGFSGFAPGFFLVGSASGISYFSSLYYAISLSEKLAGSRSGWHEFFIGAGALTGPILGGVFAEYVGAKSPYAFSIAFMIMMIFAQLIYYRHAQSSQETSASTPH